MKKGFNEMGCEDGNDRELYPTTSS